MSQAQKVHYDRNDEEIDLRDIFWRIMLCWRAIIAWAVVFAVVFGGLGYLRSVNKYQSVLKTREKKYSYEGKDISLLEASEELTGIQIREAQNIVELYRQLEEQKEYQKHDIYTELDGYALKNLYMQFYIQVYDEALSDQKSSASDINYQRQMLAQDLISAYITTLSGDDNLTALIEASGISIDRQQMSRLFSLYNEGKGNTIAFSMKLTDDMDVDAIQDTVERLLQEKYDELDRTIPHGFSLINQNIQTTYDQSVIDTQNNMTQNIYDKEADIAKQREKLTDEQEAYLFALLAIDGNKAVADRAIDETGFELKEPHISLKFIALGFILGAMIPCGIAVLKVVFAARLLSPGKLSELYNLEVLSVITLTLPKKRIFNGIDNFLIGKRDRHKKKRSLEAQIQSGIVGIVLKCEQNNVDHIALTGTNMEAYDAEILKKLSEGVENRGISVELLSDIYYNVENLTECAKIGNVFLIESVNQSIYEEIENELNKALEFQINVLGAVVLE